MEKSLRKLPTIKDLVQDTEMSLKQNALMVLLNQEPPAAWVKENNGIKYLPIERVEWLLTRIYTNWRVEIKDVKHIANSMVVTVRLYVTNPITGLEEWQDGVGAQPIQTDKGKGAIEWNYIKSNGIQLAAPAAESYAEKDAAEKFGKIFGRDLTRKTAINYDNLYKEQITPESLSNLLFEVGQKLTNEEREQVARVIETQEQFSYQKTHDLLNSKK